MAVRTVTSRQAALLRARERRRALDTERDAADQRIRESVAAAQRALDARADASAALKVATGLVAAEVRRLRSDGVNAQRTAALLELDVVEVRRLLRQPVPTRPA